MAFTFTLDAALQQRVRQEQAVQVALARTIAARGEAMALLDQLRHERERIELAATPLGAPLNGEGRMNTLYYLDRARHGIEQQRRVVAQWDGEIERVRGLLAQATHRRRALERLRERRHEEYKQELQRRLDNQLDELVTLRYRGPAGPGENR